MKIIQIIPINENGKLLYGLDEIGMIYELINTGSIRGALKWKPIIDSPNYENTSI